MLTAFAFICVTTAVDCAREARLRMVVGEGATTADCMLDGYRGATFELPAPSSSEQLVIRCVGDSGRLSP